MLLFLASFAAATDLVYAVPGRPPGGADRSLRPLSTEPFAVQTRDPAVVLLHDDGGLWLIRLGQAPRSIHSDPVRSWRDLDENLGWSLPVEDPATGAIGSIVGHELRWHDREGALLDAWVLPPSDMPDAWHWWQVFAGPEGRVAVVAHTKQGKRLWMRHADGWRPSTVPIYRYIQQEGTWFQDAAGAHRLLISDGKHGPSLLDASGEVLARYKPAAAWRIYSRAALSPDGERVAVCLSAPDQLAGLHLLRAEDLSLIEGPLAGTDDWMCDEHALSWQDDGIWDLSTAGAVASARWNRWDGREHGPIGQDARVVVDRLRASATGSTYALTDGRTMLTSGFGRTGPIIERNEGGWSLQQEDGSVTCSGASCLRFSCVTEERSHPAWHPACSDDLRIAPPTTVRQPSQTKR